jgi:hypothetical protein
MKFYETHFEEYLHENERFNLHPKLDAWLENMPKSVQELKNIVFYGASGIGKYTQMLRFVKRFSSSELKYEKKITITFNKTPYFFKISDIHYEIDMSLLGCNSKMLWHEIYEQIIEIVSTKAEKVGIIVCKNFHEINSELLDNFYSYMQKNYALSVDIKFILLTEEISFLPENILNCCEIISMSRPTKSNYNKAIGRRCNNNKSIPSFLSLETITNIKDFHSPPEKEDDKEDDKDDEKEKQQEKQQENETHYHTIGNKIIQSMQNRKELNLLKFRDLLYEILIYNLNITNTVWYILTELIRNKWLQSKDISCILLKTFVFLKYFNNNYRPIYHLENYFLFLSTFL